MLRPGALAGQRTQIGCHIADVPAVCSGSWRLRQLFLDRGSKNQLSASNACVAEREDEAGSLCLELMVADLDADAEP